MSTMSIVLFSILGIVIFTILTISIVLNYRLGMIILNVQDSIEQSLDILDERYESMSKILEIPIFFDSVEVRQVVDDIRVSRDSILKIANSLVSVDKKDELVDD
jgi:hypothetical protein